MDQCFVDSRIEGCFVENDTNYLGVTKMVKKLSAILLSSAIMLSLAACGGGNNNTNGEPKNASGTDKASGGKKVIKILHWKQENINKAITEINKKFEEKYPEYKVEYTTTGPDDEFKQAQRARITAGDVDVLADLSGMRLSPKTGLRC